MGAIFGGVQEDKRPMLRVHIVKLVQASISDDADGELDAYVQVTFGLLDPQKTKKGHKRLKGDGDNMNQDDEKANEHGEDTLSAGNLLTKTQQTNVQETIDQSKYFGETFYFPVASINTKNSLEISLWDKDIGPKITDDYIGKEIVYYSKYNEQDEVLNDASKKAKYLLPDRFNKVESYSIEITDQTGSFSTGVLDIEIEFEEGKKDENKDAESTTCSLFFNK